MSTTQAPLESELPTMLPLKCQVWMSDFYKDLEAECEEYDRRAIRIQTEVLSKHIDSMQPELQEQLHVVRSTLMQLTCKPVLPKSFREYVERATEVRQKALAAISEVATMYESDPVDPDPADPGSPKTQKPSKRRKVASRIKNSLQNLACDMVSNSIKIRLRELR